MPPKPVVATEAELKEAVAKLEEQIKAAKAEAATAVQQTEAKWQNAVKELHTKADNNNNAIKADVAAAREEASNFTQECITQLNEQLLQYFPPLEFKIEEVNEEAERRVKELDEKIQQLVVDELAALGGQFDEELQKLNAELVQQIESMAREAAEALVEQRNQIDRSIEVLRGEADEDNHRIREEVRVKFAETIEAQRKRDSSQDTAREALKREIGIELDKAHKIIREKESKAANHAEEVASKAESNRAALAETNFRHLRRIDGETQQLRDGLREVENVSTRRIEWVINKASEAIRPPVEGWTTEANHRSFYSPKFNGAGAWGMQFELQLYGPPSDKEKKENEEGEMSVGTGNLGLYLWACKGTRVACKLYIGERAKPLEKKFDGRSPVGTGRLCWLRDQIIQDDDTLRVGVEFLEALREVAYPIKQPPPGLPLTGRHPTEIDGISKAIDALEGLEDNQPFVKTPRPPENTLDGALCFMRHLNHRVFEQVQKQVESMESRMVRKIQWMVQNAGKLRQFFRWGEVMCSPVFHAAGVESLQIAFYPSGYGQVTDGFCSLFLYAPAGCTLKCYLSIASQVREINHTWDHAGAYGRTNFCLFDHSLIDLIQDTILITIEVEDAVQEVSTPWTHQEAAPRKADSHQTAGLGDRDLASITKLTKNPGKAPTGKPNGRGGKMDTAMELASIWTAKNWVEEGQKAASIPENFHSFDEILKRRPMNRPDTAPKSPKTLSRRSKSPPESPAARVHKNESAPNLHGQRMRTALEEDLAPPLPPVSAGSVSLGPTTEHWSSELPGGASSLGMARKAARRNRPGSSGATTRFGATS
jgi:hypothetical protein